MQNPRKQGDISVAAAVYYYTLLGHIVSIPTTEASRYDLLVDTGEKIIRVQCKSTRYRNRYGRYSVALRTNGGNRSGATSPKLLSSDECDFVFVWTEDRVMYEVPISEAEGKRELYLGPKYEVYKIEF